jgi:GH35 family endo-1,4-beta-xylanase
MSILSSSLDADIKKLRTTSATITLKRPDGKPLANQEVTVAQKNHKFLFGTTGSSIIALANNEPTGDALAKAKRHGEHFANLFNFATLPFYWGRFEQKQGQPDTKRLINAAKWLIDRGISVKGHPLCWHTVCADWLLAYSNDEIARIQMDRIRREVTDFRGLIDMWDVINEVVIMPIFDKYDNAITRICRDKLGRIGIIRKTFAAARAANPNAILLLNDFDMSAAYECLIEGVLEAGIKIDVIGLQSHMHQGWWGVEKTLDVLKRFARYGLPLHMTETTLVSGHIMPPEIVDLNDYKMDKWPSTPEGEARQAEETVMHYKLLMAHPQVDAITWWGLNDGGWLKAPSGLLREDESTKPGYEALARLIKGEWWLRPTKMKTDSAGQLKLNGFLGRYTIASGDKSSTVDLEIPGDSTAVVTI